MLGIKKKKPNKWEFKKLSTRIIVCFELSPNRMSKSKHKRREENTENKQPIKETGPSASTTALHENSGDGG
jgi:hypothetical protein